MSKPFEKATSAGRRNSLGDIRPNPNHSTNTRDDRSRGAGSDDQHTYKASPDFIHIFNTDAPNKSPTNMTGKHEIVTKSKYLPRPKYTDSGRHKL